MCYVGISRTAIGRIILKATVRGRGVRGRDDRSDCEEVFPVTVLNADASRENGLGRKAIVFLVDSVDVAGGQNLQGGALGRSGHGVRVLAHVEWAIVALAAPVITDGLGDG